MRRNNLLLLLLALVCCCAAQVVLATSRSTLLLSSEPVCSSAAGTMSLTIHPEDESFEPIVLLDHDVVQEGFALTDPTTGAAFSIVPATLGRDEATVTMRLAWEGGPVDDDSVCSASAVSAANALAPQVLLSAVVDDTSIVSAVRMVSDDSAWQTTLDSGAKPLPDLRARKSGAASPAFLSSSTQWTGDLAGEGGTSSRDFTLEFECAAQGNVAVLLSLTLLFPDATSGSIVRSVQSHVKISKSCPPVSCEGLCLNGGVCNEETQACECVPPYTLDAYCSFAFTADKTEVCARETLSVLWDTQLVRNEDTTALLDWVGVLGPPRTCVGCPWTMALLNKEYYSGYFNSWFYTSNSRPNFHSPDPVLSGTVTTSFDDDLPGVWVVAYFLSDSSDQILSFQEITMRPKSHPACLAQREAAALTAAQATVALRAVLAADQALPLAARIFQPPAYFAGSLLAPNSAAVDAVAVAAQQPCVYGELASDGTCTCAAGFYGQICEYGCPVVQLLTAFGGEFASTRPGTDARYTSYQKCAWMLHPLIDGSAPVSGVNVRVEYVSTEASDVVQLWSGNSADFSEDTFTLTNSLSGLMKSPTEFHINSSYVFVRFVSDPSTATAGWNSHTGFKASYRGRGCSAGRVVSSALTLENARSIATSTTWDCASCPAGSANALVDFNARACEQCPPQTYAPVAGMSECIPVSRGYFQLERGSAVQLLCSDASWPSDGCPTPPHPVRGSFGVLVAVLALLLLLLLLSGVALFVWREQRTLFYSTPLLMQLCGAALVSFTIGVLLHALPQSNVLCNLKLFFLYPAPTVLLGALSARTYRLKKIFLNQHLSVVVVRMQAMLAAVGAAVAFDLALLVALVAAAPYEVYSEAFPECRAGSGSMIVLVVLLVWKLALCGVLLFLCWTTRTVPAQYNDARSMATCVLNVLCVGAIVIASSYGPSADSSSEGALVNMQAAFAIYAVAASWALLLGWKLRVAFMQIWAGRAATMADAEHSQQGTQLNSTVNSSHKDKDSNNPPRSRMAGTAAPSHAPKQPSKAWATSPATGAASPTPAASGQDSRTLHVPSPSPPCGTPSGGGGGGGDEGADASVVCRFDTNTADTAADSAAGAGEFDSRNGGETTTALAAPPSAVAPPSAAASPNTVVRIVPSSTRPGAPAAGAAAAASSSAPAANGLLARHAAARREVNTLQAAIDKLQRELHDKSTALAQAQSKCMAISMDLEYQSQKGNKKGANNAPA